MNKQYFEKYGLWAVVTGASDGIGRSIATQLAERGLNVVLGQAWISIKIPGLFPGDLTQGLASPRDESDYG